MPRVRMLDLTRDRDYGRLDPGDVLEVDDARASQWGSLGLAEAAGDAAVTNRSEARGEVVGVNPASLRPDTARAAVEADLLRDRIRGGVGLRTMPTPGNFTPEQLGNATPALPHAQAIALVDAAPDPRDTLLAEMKAQMDAIHAELNRGRPAVAAAPTSGAAESDSADAVEAEGLTAKQADALAAAGFTTAESIAAANDEALLAVPGIGPAALEALREAHGGGE